MDRRIALVTGASRGIGRACAVALGAAGHHVGVNFVQGAEAAAETLRALESAGGSGELVPFDVGDGNGAGAALEAFIGRHGRLDVLVNNAALSLDALLLRMKDADWDRTLAVNLTGPALLCRVAARAMLRQRAGAIVNVASVVGEMGNAGQAAYASAKAGLLGLTKSLARELASRGVRVNAVSPGFIDTEMTARLPEAARAKILEQVPLGRLGRPEDVGAAVAFLASDAAAYITGEVLRVNGGLLT
jgi:3-oxoacyl-[acyl-carrier protein] reductase